jgi:hypothetical protein
VVSMPLDIGATGCECLEDETGFSGNLALVACVEASMRFSALRAVDYTPARSSLNARANLRGGQGVALAAVREAGRPVRFSERLGRGPTNMHLCESTVYQERERSTVVRHLSLP